MNHLTHILLLLPFLTLAQVGIGTTAPTSTLHVAGDVRFEVIPEQFTDSILTTDGQGNVGYRGINSFPVQTTNYQRVKLQANAPVVFDVTDFYVGDVDINMTVTVSIPANFSGVLDIRTSIPLGMRTRPQVAEGYMAITLWKNGVQLPHDSRKIDLDKEQSYLTSYRMGYIYTSHWEIVNVTNPTTHTYEVRGYIEYYSPTDPTAQFVFNMWDADPALNLNWGRGYIEYELKGF